LRKHPRTFVSGLLAVLPTLALANPTWRGDFETGDLSQWAKPEEVSADRLEIVTSPVHQGKYALKATVYQGDNPINASGNRNELVQAGTTAEGSEYYYHWNTMFAPDYPSEQTWQVFAQWHQDSCCGSPPVEFDVKGEEIMLTLHERAVWTAPLVRGVWHDFIFHVKWSEDESTGFVELWYDGAPVLPRTKAWTTSRTYLKQGLYRNSSISRVGVVYHDGMVQGETLKDVMQSEESSTAPANAAGTPARPTVPEENAAVTPTSGPGPASPASAQASSTPANSGSVIAPPSSGPSSVANVQRGGCSATGTVGLSALAFAALAVLVRRRGARIPVREGHGIPKGRVLDPGA